MKLLYSVCKLMTKKDYILTFLDKVKDIWEPARWFAVLLRYNVLDDQQVEKLFEVFQSVVNDTLNSQNKQRIQQAMKKVAEIRAGEEVNSDQLEQDLDQILSWV